MPEKESSSNLALSGMTATSIAWCRHKTMALAETAEIMINVEFVFTDELLAEE